MNSTRPLDITFFSPTMQRTGSEIVLFNLLKNISPVFHVHLITKYKGNLSGLSPSSIKTEYLYRKPPLNLFYKINNGLLKRLVLKRKLSKYINSIWYVNTIILPEIITYAQQHGIRTIVHVHELEQMYGLLTRKQIDSLIKYPELIIANSKITAGVLNSFGRSKNIEICYPGIETKNIIKNKQDYIRYRERLGISPSQFLWIMCGTLDENKNPLLFIEIAIEVLKKYPDARFLWLGTAPLKSIKMQCLAKTRKLNLSKNITWFTKVTGDHLKYFNCADGFVLTSVRESFSLVTVEALLLGLPVVAQNCGGVKEILGDDIGQIVEEKNDALKMADQLINFMNGTYQIDAGKERQRALEFDIKTAAEHWNGILKMYLYPHNKPDNGKHDQ